MTHIPGVTEPKRKNTEETGGTEGDEEGIIQLCSPEIKDFDLSTAVMLWHQSSASGGLNIWMLV